MKMYIDTIPEELRIADPQYNPDDPIWEPTPFSEMTLIIFTAKREATTRELYAIHKERFEEGLRTKALEPGQDETLRSLFSQLCPEPSV